MGLFASLGNQFGFVDIISVCKDKVCYLVLILPKKSNIDVYLFVLSNSCYILMNIVLLPMFPQFLTIWMLKKSSL